MIAPMQVPGTEVQILMPEDEHLRNEIEERGTWYENDLLVALTRVVEPGWRYVDVGAHFGNHSLFFATECKASRVLAIEAHAWTASVLSETVKINSLEHVVKVVNAVVHPTWKSAHVHFDENIDRPWMKTMLPSITEGGDVPAVSLRLMMSRGADVVKIDAEDSCTQVLESGMEAIRLQRPVVIIETHESEQEKVRTLLEAEQYTCEGQYCYTPTFLWLP